MIDLGQLARRVLHESELQEADWLEWKSEADLRDRLWQARSARFILGAANRTRPAGSGSHEGNAFLMLGVQPGRVSGTLVVDPATTSQALARYLGTVGPRYSLGYVTIDGLLIAAFTVPPSPAGHRPYLARGTFSRDRDEIRDGRIYVRRTGMTVEASADEIDEMLHERVAMRAAAGPMWPMQAESVWRDGETLHIRKRHGDRLEISDADRYTNLSEAAAIRPIQSEPISGEMAKRLIVFDGLSQLANTQPYQAVADTWPQLRAIVSEVYERLLGPPPFATLKIDRMVECLADEGLVERGWVDVSFPLYYWAAEQNPETLRGSDGLAMTYVSLAKALAAALLVASAGKAPQP